MAFPPEAVRIAGFTLRQVTSSIRTQSPYSFAQTAYDFMGGTWAADLTLAAVDARESAAISAWLASLNGPAGRFELDMEAMDYDGPQGTITADPVVTVAAQARAQTLVLQLAAAGDTISVGDYLTLDGHLHIVTGAEAPTAAFRQTLTLWPRLRAPVAPGDPVALRAPYGSWALAGSETALAVSQARVRTRTVQLVEAL
ncbi:hypothetical protein [Rhodovulum visakhapatnamense]|uniref:Uncharacterized protein n=1 Tax=Rhodovulum visakhapatnamense TaxID=364297 RepID=A0A4R8FAZ9_9RHOB|nr:hypothetical protein [Rhodovulum visakhapatnamense]TDX19817.1 hypothetical protein EV657_1545 [Rhodovulum visakhapatnamense]